MEGTANQERHSGKYGELDPRYRKRGDAQQFFVVGRVFALLWDEACGMNMRCFVRGKPVEDTNKLPDEPFSTRIMRMAVIAPKNGSCLCIPINTYAYQGVVKPTLSNAEREAHAIAYMAGEHPRYMPGENGMMTKKPIEIHPASREQKLHPASRLMFAQVYTVDWDTKVMDVGKVTPGSLPCFKTYFKNQLGVHPLGSVASKSRIGQNTDDICHTSLIQQQRQQASSEQPDRQERTEYPRPQSTSTTSFHSIKTKAFHVSVDVWSTKRQNTVSTVMKIDTQSARNLVHVRFIEDELLAEYKKFREGEEIPLKTLNGRVELLGQVDLKLFFFQRNKRTGELERQAPRHLTFDVTPNKGIGDLLLGSEDAEENDMINVLLKGSRKITAEDQRKLREREEEKKRFEDASGQKEQNERGPGLQVRPANPGGDHRNGFQVAQPNPGGDHRIGIVVAPANPGGDHRYGFQGARTNPGGDRQIGIGVAPANPGGDHRYGFQGARATLGSDYRYDHRYGFQGAPVNSGGDHQNGFQGRQANLQGDHRSQGRSE